MKSNYREKNILFVSVINSSSALQSDKRRLAKPAKVGDVIKVIVHQIGLMRK